jgi:hypothetical protein
MGTFREGLKGFTAKVDADNKLIFTGVATAARDSVVEGSAITGAPGQPVDTGYLKASWILSFPSATEAALTTNTVYAPGIEDGVGPHGPITLRSAVGGFHSVALTVAGFNNIVTHVTREVTGA